MKRGRFEVYTDANGEFRFRLRASNGRTTAPSESYKTKQGVMKGIESVRRTAATAPVVFL